MEINTWNNVWILQIISSNVILNYKNFFGANYKFIIQKLNSEESTDIILQCFLYFFEMIEIKQVWCRRHHGFRQELYSFFINSNLTILKV